MEAIYDMISSDGDVVLHYTYGELTPVIKRIPWLNDCRKTIEAICFDPTATWLLAVCTLKYSLLELFMIIYLFSERWFFVYNPSFKPHR